MQLADKGQNPGELVFVVLLQSQSEYAKSQTHPVPCLARSH
jgi:hypothetical protein